MREPCVATCADTGIMGFFGQNSAEKAQGQATAGIKRTHARLCLIPYRSLRHVSTCTPRLRDSTSLPQQDFLILGAANAAGAAAGLGTGLIGIVDKVAISTIEPYVCCGKICSTTSIGVDWPGCIGCSTQVSMF